MVMSKSVASGWPPNKALEPSRPVPVSRLDDLRAEYRFDYRKSRQNRFASRMRGNARAVVLEPDVAEVFDSSKSVNQLPRSVIAAVPPRRRPPTARRKAG
jgi:hypothetical protein